MNDEKQGNEEINNRGSGLASLTQLVAVGPDSDYIHKGATAHLFQGRYFQHTPFVINNEEYNFTVDFDKSYSIVVPIKGDFIKDIFFKFKLLIIGQKEFFLLYI